MKVPHETTVKLHFLLEDDEGDIFTGLDTALKITFAIRSSPLDEANLFEYSEDTGAQVTIEDAATGEMSVALIAENWSSLPVGKYIYQWYVKDATEIHNYSAYGEFHVIPKLVSPV